MLAPLEGSVPIPCRETPAATVLSSLGTDFAVPAPGSPPSVFADVAAVLGSTIHLAGVTSEIGGEVVCGSAAALDELPLSRAYFELLERLSVLVAMGRTSASFSVLDPTGARVSEISAEDLFAPPDGSQWRAARSNGVAIGPTWASASRSAHWELLERDRVLRSWYGESLPRSIPARDVAALFPVGTAEAYDLRAYEFSADDEGVVAGVFLFPRGEEPLVHGFAARSSRAAAAAAAARECVQRLGFLWGEPIPTSDPEIVARPDDHQEFYLVRANHPALREWLRGAHTRYRGALANPEAPSASGGPDFAADVLHAVDLTPPELVGRLCVAKAIHPQRVPLVFGKGHPWLARTFAPLLVHPVA